MFVLLQRVADGLRQNFFRYNVVKIKLKIIFKLFSNKNTDLAKETVPWCTVFFLEDFFHMKTEPKIFFLIFESFHICKNDYNVATDAFFCITSFREKI
uniref:Uncharacterized protein n=1 Tax=Romanomermis culicivorax TaxID=13658 RepID=A0A915KZT0_ROMCU